MTDDDLNTIEARTAEAVEDWKSGHGGELDGNDAWEWAAGPGLTAVEDDIPALVAHARELRDLLHDAVNEYGGLGTHTSSSNEDGDETNNEATIALIKRIETVLEGR